MELFLEMFILLSEYANLSAIFHFYGFVFSHSPALAAKWQQDSYYLGFTSQQKGFFSSERLVYDHRIGISGNILEMRTPSEEV